MPEPSRTARASPLRRFHEPLQSQPRPDLRIVHPEPRRGSPARYAQGLPGCGTPFSPLSPSRFPATPPSGATPPRSASAELVSLPVRAGSAIVQPYPQTAPGFPPSSTGGSGPPRPPRSDWPDSQRGPPPRDRWLPKPLPLEDDQRLQQELRRTDDLL